MKVFLMHRDRDVDLEPALPPNQDALTQDLELTTLFEAMAGDDQFLHEVARKTVLASLGDPRAISTASRSWPTAWSIPLWSGSCTRSRWRQSRGSGRRRGWA
jgi:hypothetical protein